MIALPYTVDVERFAGLNVHSFNLIEVFAKILLRCLHQKCLLFSIIIKRGTYVYSWKSFCGTLETCESLTQ